MPDTGSGESREFPVWRRPLHSLPTRIGFFVLAATLCTSLAITGISVSSIDSFLREKVMEKFPAILKGSQQTLDLWYAQREHELDAIAARPEVGAAVAMLDTPSSPSERDFDRNAVIGLLELLLDEHPQLSSLFVLDAFEEISALAGESFDLPESIRAQIGETSTTVVSRIELADDRRIQIASIAVVDPLTNRRATLHAKLRLDELDRILENASLGSTGKVFVVGPDGRLVAGSRGTELGTVFEAPIPAPGAPVEVVQASRRDRSGSVSIAQRFGRFGWTIVAEEDYGEAFAPVVGAIRRVLGINLAIVALFGIFAYRVAVRMVGPIEALSSAARRISQGEKEVRIPHSDSLDEVGILTRAFSEMTSRVAMHSRELEATHRKVEDANDRLRNQNDELQRVNEILAQLSITDGLTQLHNHRYFQDFLTKEAKRADRTGEPLSLILVDIDHFKRWNDRLGHAGGDEILRKIAEVMNTLIRGTDLLARYGGEEFALVAPGTSLEGAIKLAEKMRTTISETRFFITPPSEAEHVTVSMGVAIYRGDRMKLFNDADQALYRAKAAGRDCVVVADDETGG